MNKNEYQFAGIYSIVRFADMSIPQYLFAQNVPCAFYNDYMGKFGEAIIYDKPNGLGYERSININ